MSHEEQGPPIEIAGTTYEHQLADGEYDVVFMSTGIKECILAGLLAIRGFKVLQLDRNAYYGGACASLNLEELYTQYNKPYNKDGMTIF
jgi:Rab GDP dissociation inhibitor